MAKCYVSRNGRRIFTSKGEFVRRNDYPYGRWICADGRQVLFNRFYEPIYHILPDLTLHRADPAERVEFVSQEWFYDDGHSEPQKLRRAKQALVNLSNLCALQ